MLGPRVKLTAAIITLNEERNIHRCLSSLRDLVDEVVVVDSGSTDGTCEIGLEWGARVIHQPFLGHIEQKNLAWSLATGTHVLSLDADEALSPELKASLFEWKQTGNHAAVVAWSLNRRTNYCGHWVRHGGWYPDTKIRLARKDAARWTGENPHDRLEPLMEDAGVGHLAGDLLHYSYPSFKDHLNQIALFSDISATASKKHRPPKLLEIAFRQGFQWTKNAILRGGWRDGWMGLHIAWWSAHATGEKYRKIRNRIRGLLGLARAGRTEVERVWICRTDGIGDGVVTLPVVGWLRDNAKASLELIWVSRPYARAVGDACVDVDRVVTWSSGKALPKGEPLPDMAVLAFPDRELLRLLVDAKVPVLVGSKRRSHTWRHLTHGVWQSRKRSGFHEAWHGLQLIEPVRLLPGLECQGKQLPTPNEDLTPWIRLKKRRMPEFLASQNPSHQPRAVVHPGSHGSANNIDVTSYATVLEGLVREGWQIWVTGTAMERKSLDGLPWQHPEVVDATGKFHLPQLMDLLAHVDVCVAASTGPLHLAAALGTPVVGLFGASAPVWPERWRPLGPWVETLVTDELTDAGALNLLPQDIVAAVDRITSAAQAGQ